MQEAHPQEIWNNFRASPEVAIQKLIKPARDAGKFAGEAASIPYTPIKLIEEISSKIPAINNRIIHSQICVLYTIEWALWLVAKGFTNVTLVTRTPDDNAERVVNGWSSVGNVKGFVYMSEKEVIERKMKFDVVVGNPPYQEKNSKNTIYQNFYKKAIESQLFEGGIVSLITPTPIIKGLGGKKVDKVKMPRQQNVLNININSIQKRFFPGVSSTFCYFIVQKGDYNNLTIVSNQYEQDKRIIFNGKIYNTTDITTTSNIWEKCFNGLNDFNVTTSDVGKKAIKSDAGNVEVIRTINSDSSIDTYKVDVQTPHKLYNKPKLLITIMGCKSLVDYSNKLVPAKEHLIASIQTKSNQESESLQSVLGLNLRKFHSIITEEKKDQYYSFLKAIKLISLDRIWTDQELYQHFNLTEEEINLIESTIK